MREYHDREWGVPVHDDRRHFEFLLLEGAQAGLSWSTILHRRSNYARAFDGFDVSKIARYTPSRMRALEHDRGIIRNRRKIASAVNNAHAFLDVQRAFGSFDDYCWGFVQGRPRHHRISHGKYVPATSPESDAFSADLRRRGFTFVGSIIVYAHMQAVGMVNDHQTDCFRHREIRAMTSGMAGRKVRPAPSGGIDRSGRSVVSCEREQGEAVPSARRLSGPCSARR